MWALKEGFFLKTKQNQHCKPLSSSRAVEHWGWVPHPHYSQTAPIAASSPWKDGRSRRDFLGKISTAKAAQAPECWGCTALREEKPSCGAEHFPAALPRTHHRLTQTTSQQINSMAGKQGTGAASGHWWGIAWCSCNTKKNPQNQTVLFAYTYKPIETHKCFAIYVSLKCVSTSGLPDMPGRCIQVPFLSFQTCLFSSWKAAALEAAWHHICSASAGVVSRIKSLSPASLMLRSVKKQCGKKKKKTTQEKGKKNPKNSQLKTFVYGFKRALFMPDSSTLNWSWPSRCL